MHTNKHDRKSFDRFNGRRRSPEWSSAFKSNFLGKLSFFSNGNTKTGGGHSNYMTYFHIFPSYFGWNTIHDCHCNMRQPRWLSGRRRSHVHSLMIARRSLCPAKLGSNPGQGSKGINFSGWHGLDMSIIVPKRR